MAPHWAELIGWIFLGLGLASALVIAVDEAVLGYRQHMWIMNLVHPITALYWGPVWLWAYFRVGRKSSHRLMHEEALRLAERDVDTGALRQRGQSTDHRALGVRDVAGATAHCGAGCTLGDIGGEWLVYALGPLTIAGVTLWPELLFDLILAWTLGIAFQYFTIVPMREGIGRLEGLWLAIRADTVSIVAFQVGLFGWMILSATVLWQPPLPIDSTAHWWMMQVGMIAGFFTAYPVNRWLLQRGWKEKMDPRPEVASMVEEIRRGSPSRRPSQAEDRLLTRQR